MSEAKPTENAEKTVEQREPTAQEIAEYEQKRIAYMKKRMPLLKTEEQYTDLLAKIEENNARMLFAQVQYAKQKAAMTPQPEPGSQTEEKKS